MFLGPTRDGVSRETGLANEWPKDGPPVLWSKRLGTGYSAPSVLGDRLVVHHRTGRTEIIDCFDAVDGSELWTYSYPTDYRDPYGYNNGPRCTPLLNDNRCYAFGAEGKLICLDLTTGEHIWTRDTHQDWKVPDAFFGVGSTPILEGNLLIALVGGQPNSGVVAFDAATGKTVWEHVGRETWDGAETDWPNEPNYHWTGEEMVASYSSPIVATIHGKRHLLCLMRQGLVSLDPQTGEQRFRYWFRSRTHESVNAARPVVIDDKIFLSAAYRVGSAMLQVHKDGKGYDVLRRDPRGLSAHWSTPIYHDGYIYGFSGRHENEAIMQAIDVDTGGLAWKSDGLDVVADSIVADRQGGGFRDKATGDPVPHPHFGRGSLIMADGKFIILGERGTLALVRVNSEKLDELSRTSYEPIQHPSWTAPVLSRGRLYLRAEHSLLCLDVAR